ncbi:MAG TPA: ABC transporter ATP-binding protein [Candidatus Baltobacteraceae bacterium]|jgi:ABC-2 type transport system ATP-binding protein|nr:ABC transporter ATP-binding protein [Candidatus Baltobacteraceae bacterium]
MSITIDRLTKKYGTFAAVNDVTIEIPAGSVFGLLGPNGAGKTTTFKCLLGMAAPTSGTIAFDGKPLTPRTFERLSYVPERSALYEWMSVTEHLEMQRRAFSRYNAKRAAELLDLFQLDKRKRVSRMSKGMRTALAVVLAFSTEPELMVLDEPTSGLDPVNQRSVLKLIIDASAQGSTIVLSSHQIGQVERAADHIAVLKDGRIVLAGVVDELKSDSKIVEGIFETETVSFNGLATDARITRMERTGRIVRFTVKSGSDAIASQLSAMGAQSVRIVDLNLEDIFLNAVDPAAVTADVVGSV